jgi:hypothetical protein
MEKKSYSILTGDTWEVAAESSKQALAKFWAWWNSEACPCGDEDCECVAQGEASTIVIDADPGDDEA